LSQQVRGRIGGEHHGRVLQQRARRLARGIHGRATAEHGAAGVLIADPHRLTRLVNEIVPDTGELRAGGSSVQATMKVVSVAQDADSGDFNRTSVAPTPRAASSQIITHERDVRWSASQL